MTPTHRATTATGGGAVATASAAPGTVVAATDATFAASVLDNPLPVLVDFWAVWCPPCRMMAPILKKIAADYAGRLAVVSLNCDEEPETARTYGILAMPTFTMFQGGEQVASVVGARSGIAMRRIIDNVLGG